MAIRLRTLKTGTIALCAAETDPVSSDVYLNDEQHYALAAKFAKDWQGQFVDWTYEDLWNDMESQKQRDAQHELTLWLEEQRV